MADSDNDGIADDADGCPNSDLVPTIVIDSCDSGVQNTLQADGCTLSDEVGKIASSATNHGRFVSAISRFTDGLVRNGTLSGGEKGAIEACAARAAIP